jgi:predicted regulator of amino acid metabolism with ACT domain
MSSEHKPEYDAIAVTVERLTAMVGTARSDVADVAAVVLNQGDVRRLLRALQSVHEVCDQVEANPVGWGGPEAVSLTRTLRTRMEEA